MSIKALLKDIEEDVVKSRQTLRWALESAVEELDFLIACTPTGPRRNELTDCMIHVKSAVQKLDIQDAEIQAEKL